MSKKQQKMSLTAFLADESLGAWADDVADLPTARKIFFFVHHQRLFLDQEEIIILHRVLYLDKF